MTWVEFIKIVKKGAWNGKRTVQVPASFALQLYGAVERLRDVCRSEGVAEPDWFATGQTDLEDAISQLEKTKELVSGTSD